MKIECQQCGNIVHFNSAGYICRDGSELGLYTYFNAGIQVAYVIDEKPICYRCANMAARKILDITVSDIAAKSKYSEKTIQRWLYYNYNTPDFIHGYIHDAFASALIISYLK